METNDINDAIARLEIARDITENNNIILEDIRISRLYLEGILHRVLGVNWNLQDMIFNLDMKKG